MDTSLHKTTSPISNKINPNNINNKKSKQNQNKKINNLNPKGNSPKYKTKSKSLNLLKLNPKISNYPNHNFKPKPQIDIVFTGKLSTLTGT